MNKRLLAFAIALLFLTSYTLLAGKIFGRDYNGNPSDKDYHIAKSLNPLGCCNNEYYSPLFHIIVFLLAFFIGNYNAINFFVAVLLFLMMPYAFNKAYNSLWGERKDTTSYYFLVPFFPVLVFIINTWPAALNMFFMLMLLYLMFRRANLILILGTTFLGFFSHTAGGFWIVLTTIFYLMLTNRKIMVLLALALTAALIIQPSLCDRPVNIIKNFINIMDLTAVRIIEVVLIWMSPLILWLIYTGLKERRFYGLDDMMIMFAVLVAFGSAILDSQLRPILNGMLLLGLYGFKGFEKHATVAKILTFLGILWWVVLVISIIIM